MIEKPWYKKWWGIFLIILGILFLIGSISSQENNQNSTDNLAGVLTFFGVIGIIVTLVMMIKHEENKKKIQKVGAISLALLAVGLLLISRQSPVANNYEAKQQTVRSDNTITNQTQQVQQAPEKTDLEILAEIEEIENRVNEWQKKLKNYYPSNNMLEALAKDYVKLITLKANYAKPKNKTQKKILLKAKLLEPRVEIFRREAFAKNIERGMLDKGINFEVQTKGANKQILEFKYVLTSKAFVYNVINKTSILESARDIGFKKVIFTDGFNNSWTYDLTKPN